MPSSLVILRIDFFICIFDSKGPNWYSNGKICSIEPFPNLTKLR